MYLWLYLQLCLWIGQSFLLKRHGHIKKRTLHSHTRTHTWAGPPFCPYGTNLNLIHALNCFGACDAARCRAASARCLRRCWRSDTHSKATTKKVWNRIVHNTHTHTYNKSYKCCRLSLPPPLSLCMCNTAAAFNKNWQQKAFLTEPAQQNKKTKTKIKAKKKPSIKYAGIALQMGQTKWQKRNWKMPQGYQIILNTLWEKFELQRQ